MDKSERLEIRVDLRTKSWLEGEAKLQNTSISDVVRDTLIERQRHGVQSLDEAYRRLGLAPMLERCKAQETGKGYTTAVCVMAALGVLHGEKALMVATTQEVAHHMAQQTIRFADKLGAIHADQKVSSATARALFMNPHLWAGGIGRVYTDHWIDLSKS